MNTVSTQNRHNHPQQGFTLLEVLISLVVLSIGLLGLAGLQSTGLRFNQSAAMRTQATQLAYDMSDRMRANMAGVNSGAYLNASTGTFTAAANCHSTTGCDTATMAEDDLAVWNTAVGRYLPEGAWVICNDASPNDGTAPDDDGCDNAAASPFAIKLWWDDNRDGSLDPTPFAIAFEP